MSKGFTFIEVLICVAIVGMLVAILLPVYECKTKGICPSAHQPTYVRTCVAGYIFVHPFKSDIKDFQQLIGADGKPVTCEVEKDG